MYNILSFKSVDGNWFEKTIKSFYIVRHLVDVGQDVVFDLLLVLGPVLTILLRTRSIVSAFPVNEKDSEVEHVKVREDYTPALRLILSNNAAVEHLGSMSSCNGAAGREDGVTGNTGRQAERRCLQPVPKVVDVTRLAPPAGSEKLCTSLRLEVRQAGHFWIVGIAAEEVLLRVGGSEDIQTSNKHSTGSSNARPSKVNWVDGEVTSLGRIQEWYPSEVAECQHIAEAVGSDIHHRHDSSLQVLSVEHVIGLESRNENDAVRNIAVSPILLSNEGQIYENPSSKPLAHLAECLEVNLAEEG